MDLRTRLTSRKFWLAVATVIALLVEGTELAEAFAAFVTMAYVIAEAMVDASGHNKPSAPKPAIGYRAPDPRDIED